MAWEYRLIKAETEELYERALNAAVRKDEKGVEQLFGRRVEESLTRPCMPLSTAIGASQWSALMKRSLAG